MTDIGTSDVGLITDVLQPEYPEVLPNYMPEEEEEEGNANTVTVVSNDNGDIQYYQCVDDGGGQEDMIQSYSNAKMQLNPAVSEVEGNGSGESRYTYVLAESGELLGAYDPTQYNYDHTIESDQAGDMVYASTDRIDESTEENGWNPDMQFVQQQATTSEEIKEEDVQKNQTSFEDMIREVIRPSTSSGGAATVSGENGAPLGSSQNPIRIIQQGNKYTSLQHLSGDQLSQIMQVVQQQQTSRTKLPTGGSASGRSSILYNPQTQTKIIYRVVYPSESKAGSAADKKTLTSDEGSGVLNKTSVITGGQPIQQKRTYIKRKRMDVSKRARTDGDASEMNNANKDMKKKQRPRTRSGRVSRPPKFMVKDYKHIHPVDYSEDYDDSDGGYSDFRPSSGEDDGEGGRRRKHPHSEFMDLYGENGRMKSNKCEECGKSYIGRGGLARHFRLNPTHGQMEDEPVNEGDDPCTNDDVPPSVGNELSEDTVPETATTMPLNVSASVKTEDLVDRTKKDLIERTKKHVSISLQSNDQNTTMNKEEEGEDNGDSPDPPEKENPRKGKRGRPPAHDQAEKRRLRLEELVGQCTDEVLMDVVMPRLLPSISLWEFIVLRAANGLTVKPEWPELLRQLAELQEEVRDVVKDRFIPVDPKEDAVGSSASGAETIEIKTEDMARYLGLSLGHFKLKVEAPTSVKPRSKNSTLVSRRETLGCNSSTETNGLEPTTTVPDTQPIPLPLRKRVYLADSLVSTETNGSIVSGEDFESLTTIKLSADELSIVTKAEREMECAASKAAPKLSCLNKTKNVVERLAKPFSSVSGLKDVGSTHDDQLLESFSGVLNEGRGCIQLNDHLDKTAKNEETESFSQAQTNSLSINSNESYGCEAVKYGECSEPCHEIDPSLDININGACDPLKEDYDHLTSRDFDDGVVGVSENVNLPVDVLASYGEVNHGMMQVDGEVLEEENAYQPMGSDELMIVHNLDGSIQIHGAAGQTIPIEAVQALFGVEGGDEDRVYFEPSCTEQT